MSTLCIGDTVCTDLAHGYTYPDGSSIPFVSGPFYGYIPFSGAVYVIDGPIYRRIEEWRPADAARPYVIAGATSETIGDMAPRYARPNALSRDLRGEMVGWSHDLADRIAALQPGGSMFVHTLSGRALIAREI